MHVDFSKSMQTQVQAQSQLPGAQERQGAAGSSGLQHEQDHDGRHISQLYTQQVGVQYTQQTGVSALSRCTCSAQL